MKKIIVKDILKYCNGFLVCGDENIECIEFSKDTRTIKTGDVYLGIKGEKFNGSEFYREALEKGAKVCILQDVEISEDIKRIYNDRVIIKVKDVIKALQEIAKYKRSLYNIPVIAITGSVGKTSTKDIVASVLLQKYNVLKTEENLNNHIGLPLTILRLKKHDAMVIEMGMDNFGEIRLLTSIAKPTIAIITNIGTAHIGKLGSRENILKAKLEIIEGLKENGTLIINNDNDLLNKWNKQNREIKVKTFGIENDSDIKAYNIKTKNGLSTYNIKLGNKEEIIEIPIGGKVFVYNSLCALYVGIIFKIELEKILCAIKNFELSKSRMDIEKRNNITIIDDCYNANYDSMKAGIEYLGEIIGKRKIAVLGDMLELGEFSKELHEKVGVEVFKNNIDMLITVGKDAKNIAIMAELQGMNRENIFIYDNNMDAIKKINLIKTKEDCILVKASNGMNFKEIVKQIRD